MSHCLRRLWIAAALVPYCFGMVAHAQSPSGETDEAAKYRDHGGMLYESGKLREALAAYSRSLELKPDPVVYVARATTWRQLENIARAVADCDEAIRLDPKLAIAYVIRAIAHDDLGDVNRAIADATVGADLDPQYSAVFQIRAMLWQNLEQYELAQRDWDQVLRLAPDTLEAYVGRALCWRAAGKWKRAVEDLTSALKLDPNWQAGYIARGKARVEAQEFAAAKADFEHAVRLDDRDVTALNALAYLLVTCPDVRFRDYRRGVDAASRCCELTGGKSFDHLAMLATACAQAGRFADAVRWQSEALRLAPDDQTDDLKQRLAIYRRGEQPFPAEQRSVTHSTAP